jgi:hypothetical protein
MNTPARKVLVLAVMATCFVLIADGLAMLLPGPASALGGAAIFVVGLGGLAFGLPRFLSASGQPFRTILAARFGLVALPVLCGPVAWLWSVSTPEALTLSFGVAWLSVWVACFALSAAWPCPVCRQPFGRRGASFQLASSACAHCGANPRSSGDSTSTGANG